MSRSSQRVIPAFLAALAILISASTIHAYRLPPYQMSDEERTAPAEETFEKYEEELAKIATIVPLGVVDNRRRNKARLSPKARRAARDYRGTKEAHTFWSYVVKLKGSLVSLHVDASLPGVNAEADKIAKAVIQEIYDLSQKYEIAFSALVNNALINAGVKEKGFCYHYVSEIRKALGDRAWRHFDLHWGEAWPRSYRENNALVVTAAGRDFRTGIAIDAWRTAGKPYWTKVEGDRFPWREANDVDENYELR